MSAWDITLIVTVSLMGTAVAYIRHPEHKAFVLMLPVPFTLATLAVNRPLDATNVLSMGLLFGFSFTVWALHAKYRWPILPAISLAAAGYCLAGSLIASLQPVSSAAFWISTVIMFSAALALIRVLPQRREPHHRTPLPVWIKFPAIALVITCVVSIKQHLGGFMTMFPMVGVVAAYEARNSLWTILRRIPWIIITMTPVMISIRLTQQRLGLPVALALAWPLLLVQLWFLRTRYNPALLAVKKQ